MSDRLSRSEIKNDEVREVLDHILIFGRDHWRSFATGGAAIVVVLLGIWGYSLVQSNKATEAQVELAKALRVIGARIDAEAPAPEDPDDPSFVSSDARREAARPLFEAVLAGWPTTPAAGTAEMYLADLDLAAGDSTSAVERWRRVVESEMGASSSVAKMNIVQLARSEGRLDASLAELETELDNKDAILPQDLVLSELASTLAELGHDERAEATLKRLIEEHPTSPFTFEAQQKLGDRAL